MIYPGIQAWEKSMNVIYHIKKEKSKLYQYMQRKHLINANTKKNPKPLNQLGIEGNLLKLIWNIYKKKTES